MGFRMRKSVRLGPLRVERCGDPGPPWVCHGAVHPLPGETVTVTEVRRTRRSGREYTRDAESAAWPVLRLFARRCPACGHESVFDKDRGESVSLTMPTLFDELTDNT